MNLRTVLALLLSAALSGAAFAASAVPMPYKAEYTVHADGFKVGEMTRKLRPLPDGTWELESSLYTTGLVALFKSDKLTERSIWQNGAEGLMPISYHSRYTGSSKNVVERLAFDWERGVITSLRDGRETDVPLTSGVMDKLLYQVALRRDLASGASHIEYQVADRGKIETYEFDVLGREKVVTSLGEYDTIKVKKGTTTFWVAPALDYLVVQIVQHEDDHTLSSYITDMDRP